MLIVPIQVGPLQANCYLVAHAAGTAEMPQPCLVIDPGMDAAAVVAQACEQLHLQVTGVVATHGHLDHVADAAAVADAAGVPIHIHQADEHLLTQPSAGLSSEFAALIAASYPEPRPAPHQVAHLEPGSQAIAEFTFQVAEAPGHTPGSVLLSLQGVDLSQVFHGADAGPGTVVFTGDVLLAGSIGRTDLPGSDPAAMQETLRGPVAEIPDQAYLLPGHGSPSRMAHERAHNPYLR